MNFVSDSVVDQAKKALENMGEITFLRYLRYCGRVCPFYNSVELYSLDDDNEAVFLKIHRRLPLREIINLAD